MKWFKHDAAANRDAKLQKVRMKYGLEGYGLYWYCLELIAEGVDEHNLTFELEHDAEIIAFNTGVHRERVEEMMTYMSNLSLFENQDGVITCYKLAKRLDQSSTSNPHMRKLISEIKKNHDSVMIKSGQNHDYVMTESDQTRLDKIRLEKDKTLMSESSDSRREDSADSSIKVDPTPYNKIVDLYHEQLSSLPKVIKLSAARKAQIKARWNNDLFDLDDWKKYFQAVKDSDFLMGRSQPTSNRQKPFVADLEWLTKEANMIKIIEGKYHG